MNTVYRLSGKRIALVFILNIAAASFMIAADGFGRNATGGAAGTAVTVNNAVDFANYVALPSPYIITVSGTINLGGNVYVASNKTIQGAGRNDTVNGDIYLPTGVNNVIIQNLNITNPSDLGEGDGVTIYGATNVFVTHCTFTDCADGMCDVTQQADSVTISWCRFRYVAQSTHCNVNLIGSADGIAADAGRLHVTFHHCWYDQKCVERMPSVRYGRVHVYNNYYSAAGNNYCVRTRIDAECRIENNYFENVRNPWELLTTTDTTGRLYAANNNVDYLDSSNGVTWVSGWYPGQSLIPGTDGVFTPPYSYTLDNSQDVKSAVMAGAGLMGVDAVTESFERITTFLLYQNYPNPFNPTTVISYRLSEVSSVSLKVYDILGREILVLVNEQQGPGYYRKTFDARSYAGGIYVYQLIAIDGRNHKHVFRKAMVLVK
jgi:pectate lyase